MGQHTFTVYKTATCPYCHQALEFLEALGSQRNDIRVVKVDANADPAQFRKVASTVGRSTVPQIFLDDHYVGGWDDLARAANRGQLDAYLGGQEWGKATQEAMKPRWWRRSTSS